MSLVALYDKKVEKHPFVQNTVTVAILSTPPPPHPLPHIPDSKNPYLPEKPVCDISHNATHSSE